MSRAALLLVLLGLAFLYIGPARSYVEARGESAKRQEEVRELREENDRLRARRRQLEDPRALELEARRLGMVRPGERSYVIKGLPGD